MSIVKLVGAVLVISFLARTSFSYELQDTIKKLQGENAYLHHRLENLTQALRELRKLLDHSKGHDFSDPHVDHNSDQLHVWTEWIHNGISAETHHLIEQAFCLSDHDLASAFHPANTIILMFCTMVVHFLFF